MIILHLSDLHFGPHSRFADEDPARLGIAFHRALAEAREQLGIKGRVDLVVVTGDVAEAAKPKEYDAASGFLTGLAGELGLEHRRFVFVPGNHDVSRPLCKKVAADQDIEDFDDDELRRRIDEEKLKFYDAFVREFYDVDDLNAVATPLGRGATLHNFPELRLSVAVLNSCELESHRQGDHRGYVSREQAQAVMDAWRTGEPSSWLKVLAVHHNPVTTTLANRDQWREHLKSEGGFTDELIACYESDVVGFEGQEQLKAIVEDASVQLVLHGHHHAQDEKNWPWRVDGRAHVLSAGSLSLTADRLPKAEPASLRCVHLDPEERKIRVYSLVYTAWARTRGEVTPGAFTPDSGQDYRQDLDLPADFEGTAEPKATPKRTDDRSAHAAFLRTFRQRFRRAYSHWDLAHVGVTQAGGAARPIEATLDDMYLPLRMAEGFKIDQTDRGAAITPEELLARESPLAIRGPAGSGKTTWMRWTFRRLLGMEGALPIMVVLRDLARRWQASACKDADRSLDAFLDGWVSEHLGKGWDGELKSFLQAPDGPRPVLLVDGWDELGQLGGELRRKLLGFMDDYRRIAVVVSSRPYGEGRPSDSEGFEVVDIQPLADGEIAELATRFFTCCHGGDEGAVGKDTERFERALVRSPEAQALARTALLLTMMLLISRARPLPDKRHLLYGACVENLLTALPDRREEEGALLPRERWRPDDSEERMRVVAALAFDLQETGYKLVSRSPIVRSWDGMAALLPETWHPKRRMEFLAWLAGPAGLLTDRADDTLAFAHVSFQEYLSAWHLNATVEGGERTKVFHEQLGNEDWWETLLLWAALIQRQSTERIEPVLESLRQEGERGVSLAGMMLADGLGSEEGFSAWIGDLLEMLEWCWPEWVERCMRAWSASRQDQRREAIVERIRARAPETTWLGWLGCEGLIEHGSLALDLPKPRGDSLAYAMVTQLDDSASANAASVAAGRVLCGGFPVWPIQPSELGLLHTWPGHRRLAGLRLQMAALCEAPPGDLRDIAGVVLLQPRWNEETQKLTRFWERELTRDWARQWRRNWTRDLARDWAHFWGRELARDWARDLVRNLGRDLARFWAGCWARELARDWVDELARDWARHWVRHLTRDWTHYLARDWAHYLTRNLAHDWNLAPDTRWLETFSIAELWSSGRGAARSALANLRVNGPPESRLLTAASRLSLNPQSDPEPFAQALAQHGPTMDPLWPALARHLARRSTADDRALLIDLAQHPEKREPPLCWGLQFIVRGDLIFDGGKILTLDELADEVGVPRLPYLEDLPDELELDEPE